MKSTSFLSILLATILVAGIAGSSQAATNVTSTVNFGLTASTSGTSASASSNTSANTSASGYSNSSTSADAMNASSQGSGSAQSNTAVNTSATIDTSGLLNVSISGDSVRSSSATDASVSSPVQVQTGSDLQAYAETVARTDTSVSAVSTTDSDVDVTFKRPAKLFGFIPTTINETAHVSATAEGGSSVVVRKSWWSFLATSDTMSDDLSTSIQSKVSAHGSLSSNATLSSQAKALIISDIQSSSQALYGASADASASAHASASSSY